MDKALDPMSWHRRLTQLRRQTEQILTTAGVLASELAELERAVGEYETRPGEEQMFAELAISEVCRAHRVESWRIFTKQRDQTISAARHMLYYLLYEHTGMSFPQVGLLLGRDHTSVIHGHKLIAARAGREPLFNKEIEKTVDAINVQIAAAVKAKAAQESYVKQNPDSERNRRDVTDTPIHPLPTGEAAANTGVQNWQRLALQPDLD